MATMLGFPAPSSAGVCPAPMVAGTLTNFGGSQAHQNMQPFLVLSFILGMQSGIRWLSSGRVAAAGFLIVVLIGIIFHINDYRSVVEIWKATDWFAAKARRLGAEIHRLVPRGKVLTIAPAFPLAGHVPIYPEFATGPFAWRTAHLVPVKRRARLHLIAPADLEEFLAADPPAGILTGFEDDGDMEMPLIEYAQRHGYTLTEFPKKRHLWVAPNAPE